MLDFIADEGFNIVRIPTDYRCFVKNAECEPDERGFEYIDEYIQSCCARGLHINLNIHRAPGYCINRPELEKTNLWRDSATQDVFVSLWEYIARRYAAIPASKLSFDIINEPCNIPPTHPCTREDYSRLMRRVTQAIRSISPERQLTIDGFNGGGTAVPELADIGATHSGRGYEPFRLTHYKAEWVRGGADWDMPQYPGEVQPGEYFDIDSIRKYYEPWKEVEKLGVNVHIGEFGCYNKVHNDVALRWLEDLVTVYRENRWGYALWNFEGAFGIVNHGRPGTVYRDYRGFNTDTAMLQILKKGML